MTKLYEQWRKSSHSNPDGHCVEVARAARGTICVRDSKGDPTIVLEVDVEEWRDLVTTLKGFH